MGDAAVRILLVEDDEDDYLLTREYLLESGPSWFELYWASTFEQAISLCEQDEFDVCLLDYRLGDRNAVELLHALLDLGCQMPVIVLTGHANHTVDIDAMRAGAADFLVKGEINGALLERAIRYTVTGNRAERELAEAQRRLAASREAERTHLAQELHDGPLQDLHALLFQLVALADHMPDGAATPRLADSQATLRKVIDQLRVICGELRPPALTAFGLEVAIRGYVDDYRKANPQLKVSLDLMPDGQQLPEDVRLALYRICQQALNNVSRHAAAGNVTVRLTLSEQQVVLEVRDDGIGFTVPSRWLEFARAGHFGLLGADERAVSVAGRLDIDSQPGSGTAVHVLIPRQPGSRGLWRST